MDSVVALLFPAYCRLCQRNVLLRAQGAPLCPQCEKKIQVINLGTTCYTCGEPIGFEPEYGTSSARYCEECHTEPPAFQRATAYGVYDDLRAVLRLFKFQSVRNLSRPLGEMLAEAILKHDLPTETLVVPVPLYRRKRIYNQSALLAQAALPRVRAARPDCRLRFAPDALKRLHQTESQYRLSPNKRRENVRGAFGVQGNVRDQHILLIDDVYTTGATVSECARVLLNAGAASVRVSTLARAGRQIATRWTPPTASMESAAQSMHGSPENIFYPVPMGP